MYNRKGFDLRHWSKWQLCGAAASGHGEIPHIQGQERQLRFAGGSEEILHVQEQRRSPSKMVGVPNWHSESNPIPARDAQRAQTNLVRTRT